MTEHIFTIGKATIRARHRNTAIGLVLAAALCLIAWRARLASTDPYHAMLLGAVIATVILLGVVHFWGHFRYTLRSRDHRVEVGEDRVIFTTGQEETSLELADVLLIERQKRLGEGPSLMMRLRNQRIVRLDGYDRQEHLMKLVEERFERVSARA